MVSTSAVPQGAEQRLPLLLFAHRHAEFQLLDLGTFSLISAGDNIQMSA